jgi:hypothetical protein
MLHFLIVPCSDRHRPPLQTHGLAKLAWSNRYYDTSHIGTSNSKDNLGRYGKSHLVGHLCIMRFVISSFEIGVEMQKLQESKLKILSLFQLLLRRLSQLVCGANFRNTRHFAKSQN